MSTKGGQLLEGARRVAEAWLNPFDSPRVRKIGMIVNDDERHEMDGLEHKRISTIVPLILCQLGTTSFSSWKIVRVVRDDLYFLEHNIRLEEFEGESLFLRSEIIIFNIDI